MRSFLVLLISTTCGFGYQSLHLPANASVTLTIPNVLPFTAMGDYRAAFRLHDWTLPASGQVTLINLVKGQITLNSSGQLCGVNLGDTADWGNAACVSVSGLSDVVVRMQRMGASFPVQDPEPGSNWFEVQDLSSGNMLTYACVDWVNTGCPIQAAINMSIVGNSGGLGSNVGFSVAWLKWFSATVPPGSPMENESTAADLADWRFEGNYANAGTAGLAVTLSSGSGGPSFVGSPVRPPACNLVRQILRAGTAAQLTNYAYPLDGGSSLQYVWQQLSGPTSLSWTGQKTSQPTVTGGVFGSYVLQLAVTDEIGQISTCSIKDGFVATDENGVVESANPQVDVLLGPQIQLGKNPWSWFDDRHVAEATLQIANLSTYYNLSAPPWNIAQPGTIATVNNSSTVIGSGTSFTTTFCQGPGNPTVPKSAGAYITIWYPNSAVQGGTGRRTMPVISCQSDTALTLSRAWNDQGFLTAGSDWNYAYVDGNTFNTWAFNAAPADFYDVVAALYALYYRSGIDDYATWARIFADNYFQFRLDSGRNYFYGEGYNTFPRNRALLGMVLRALDGRPDMWSGLELIANFTTALYHATFQNYGPWTQIPGDPRENGYELAEVSYCALFDPNPTPAAACRAGLGEMMTKAWTASRFPDGNWYSFYWAGFGGGPTAALYGSWWSGTAASLTNGSPTVTCVSVTGTCNWTPDMFTVNLNNVNYPQVWWFLNSASNLPQSNGDGDPIVYYPVQVDSTHVTLHDINGNTVGYQGATGLHGWTVGTVAQEVGFGVQPYMLGILATAFDFASKAMACTGDGVPANCDIAVSVNAAAYNIQAANYLRTAGYWPAAKGMYYSAGFVNCTPPVSDANVGCTGGNNAGQARVLNAEALRGVMTGFANSGDPNLSTFSDTLYTAMWGKPGFSLPTGQTSDGEYISGYNDGYGWFMIGTPPAGQAHKYFGMGWGIGAGSAWPGYRAGGLHTGAQVSSSIAVDVGAVPHTATFNLLVSYPTGATATINCSASPCLVSFAQNMGNPSVKVQYLSAGGAVLATQPYSFPIILN